MSVLFDISTGLRKVLRAFRGSLLVTLQSVGLWEGKQFRMYRNITTTQVFRFRATVPFLLTDQRLYCEEGSIRIRILTGATPSGVWTAIPTQSNKNRLSTHSYVQQNVIEAGGTIVGGAERELLAADSGSGQGVGFSNIDLNPRVLPAGDYYFECTAVGSTWAIYTFEHEEMPELA